LFFCNADTEVSLEAFKHFLAVKRTVAVDVDGVEDLL
jgi:hypothetical protein